MIEFTCKPDGADPYKVTATARDVLVWEKALKSRTFTKLMAELPLEDLYKIAWLASKRLGLYADTAESFELNVDLVFEADEEGAAAPFPSAA